MSDSYPGIRQPTSIKIVGWALLVSGIVSAITFIILSARMAMDDPAVMDVRLAMANDPLPLPLQWSLIVAERIVLIAAGIAILNEHNWGRWLYLIWSVPILLLSLSMCATGHRELAVVVLPISFLVVFCIVMFGSSASDYYAQFSEPVEKAEQIQEDKELLEHDPFAAQDEQGNMINVRVFQVIVVDRKSGRRRLGAKDRRSEEGHPVNRIDRGEYEMMTPQGSVRLVSSDPNAV